MIPPPAPACRRQARMPMKQISYANLHDAAFITAAQDVNATGRREAQVVG